MKQAGHRAEGRKVRPEKAAMADEFRAWVEGSDYIFLADNLGLGMARTTALRARLRKVGGRYRVVRNRLFRRAFSEVAGAAPGDLLGPTAVVVGQGDAAEVARALLDFVKEHDRPAVKAGVIEGRRLDAADVKALGSLPVKPVLQAMLVGTLAAPMTRLAGVLQQKVASLVYVLKAVEEKTSGA